MSSLSEEIARSLLTLYRSDLREFLVDNGVGNVSALDQQAQLLERALTHTGELKIGFVGQSQVGKSSLINALLDRQALPSGGIGPLTAQATRVAYAEENSLSVRFHAKQQLHQHAFAIARYLERRGDLKRTSHDAEVADEVHANQSDHDDVASALLVVEDIDDGTIEPSLKEERSRHLLNQARRILCFANPTVSGKALSDVELLDGLRAVLGQKLTRESEAIAALGTRIEEIRALLGRREEISESSEGSAVGFNRALRERAAGWMSPLVGQLELHLRSDMLRSLSLVDLPGIGVLNDPAGKEAEQFVTQEGDALVVVFHNAGVTEIVAELLERTGVITKLLFGGTGDVPTIQVVLAVTHLDDVAHDRYRVLSQEARDMGARPPDRDALFQTLSSEMAVRLREMIGDALKNSSAFEDLPPDQYEARERVVSALCRGLEVYCVASPDYLDLTQGNGDSPTFLRDPEATNVPALRRHLSALGREASTRRENAIAQFAHGLNSALRDHLAAIARMYEEGRGAAALEYERFRDELNAKAEPLRQTMMAYHGEAIGLLRQGMHAELKLVCKDAEIAARKKLQRLTREGRSLPYASVKAALVRNGVWERRGVNYPEALTLSMVDSIATHWEPRIVDKVRAEVRTLADRDLKLVERLCEEARALNARILADSSIDAQKRVLQANSRTAVAWTKEQLEELRAVVSKTLRTTVQKPIERACLKALRDNVHSGTGARERILSAFEDGGEAAIEEARDRAEAALKEHYSGLLRRLNEGFLKDNIDPVQAVLEALTGEQVARARRSDAARKRLVAERVQGYLARMPRATAATPTIAVAAV